MTIFVELIENIALVLLLVSVQQFIFGRWHREGVAAPLLSGVLYGAIGIVVMAGPFVLAPGYVFDGRSVILTIAGLFGGPVVAAVAVLMCGAYRLWVGGIGAAVGTFVIVESAAFGLVFYYLRRRGLDVMRPAPLLLLGVLVHAVLLWAQVFALGSVGLEAVRRIGVPVIVLFPLAIVLVARLLLDQEERQHMRESLERQSERLTAALDAVIRVVGSVVEMRDPYTAGHQRRAALLASRIAEELELPAAQVRAIEVAALLHDVGKIAVPAEVLAKPGELSEIEKRLVRSHADAGYRLLLTAEMEGPVTQMVRQHHERCDGSGYPLGLKGPDLLLGSRVLMVADVVAAMSAHRPYRVTFGIETALETIRQGAGTLFDRVVDDACLDVFEDGEFSFE